MKKVAILAALAVLISLPGLAAADMVSYDTSTPISLTLTDWTGSLAFQKFNSKLGRLTQVELYLSSDMNTKITVTNNSPTSNSSGAARTELVLGVQDALGRIPLLSSDTQPYQQIDNTFPSRGFSFTNLLPNHSVTSGTYTSSPSSDYFYTDGILLSEFTGSGNILLNASTQTYTNISYTGGVATATQTTQAGLTGTVIYYFDPVPIPPTALLLGSGLVGLVALARRKKKPTA